MKWLHQWLLGDCSRSCRGNPSCSATRASVWASLCLHRQDLPCKGIFPLKSIPDISFQNSLSRPAGANMNLFCFASSAQMKGYFSSAIYAPEAPIPHCKAGLGFLSFTAFLHTTYPHSLWLYFWALETHSRSLKKLMFLCRIDFIQHNCCKECQLPNCVINLIKTTAGKKKKPT